MNQWSLTLHGPGGILGSFDSGEAQFILGTEEADDVLRVVAEGVAHRHAWVWLAGEHMQVEDLAGGTLVNGHPIERRVEVEYPASVQVGEVTLVVEVKAVAASPAPTSVPDPSLAVTIPQRRTRQNVTHLDVTIPQRAIREAEKRRTETHSSAAHQNKAPLTGEYTLVREIARGGMGQIYFGEDPQLKRQVAVKVSSVAYGGEDPRFSKEAEVLVRWPDALEAYQAAVQLGMDEKAQENLALTEELLSRAKSEGEAKAKVALFEALNRQGRQYEAMEFGKGLGDFWKERKRDASALPELVKRLEAKLLPVPGTEVLMSSTEMTVGEWKLYLKAEGLPEWQQPNTEWTQTDEHPVVKISWNKAKELCEWLSAKTGREWRLPTNVEWDKAVGASTYPWGEYFPPKWNDGNYAVQEDGKEDPQKAGVDGIKGTAPVGSFKPNALGFYDLGGNVDEWMRDSDNGKGVRRGANWIGTRSNHLRSSFRTLIGLGYADHQTGLRIVRGP